MGKNNKARRAAKARARNQAKARSRDKAKSRDRASRPGRSDGGGRSQRRGGDIFGDAYQADPEGFAHDRLMDAASFRYQDSKNDRFNPDLQVATLRLLARVPLEVLATAGERALLSHLGLAWNGGWQPVEVLRQARLHGSRAATARLMAEAIANDDARRRAATLDQRWIAQVDSMDLPPADGRPGWIHRWVRQEGLEPSEARDVMAEALALLFLPQLEPLIPPPGSTGATSTRSAPTRTDAASERDPLLERIRALLAKAESTDFEEEAMAFTAKAQELITRHAIDAALLADGDAPTEEEPSIIRVPLDPPYGDAKGLMLQIVAEHTRCRAVMMAGLNMSRVVGYPADLTAVEMLFTSLLIQAQTALAQAGRSAPPGTRTRSSSYRSTFLVAYANRIGDRLTEINAAVAAEVTQEEGDSFLPVLRAQEDRIDDFMAERFGETVSSGVRGGYDPAAAAHGRMAADSAQLSFGDVEGETSRSDQAATPALPAR
ncbi:MAG: DUF2786 domain-containing protein [Microthrixaceae bacterium]